MSGDYAFRGSNSESQEYNQKSVEERVWRLLKELEQYQTINLNNIERDEAKTILDQRLRHTGRIFDDELIDAIFNIFDKDLSGKITKREFCQGYIDVETFFAETINTWNYKVLELK